MITALFLSDQIYGISCFFKSQINTLSGQSANEFLLRHASPETIGTQYETIPLQVRQNLDIRNNISIYAQCFENNVRLVGQASLFFSQNTAFNHFKDHRMIEGPKDLLAAPYLIYSAVSNMGNCSTFRGKHGSRDSCSHTIKIWVLLTGLQDVTLGFSDCTCQRINKIRTFWYIPDEINDTVDRNHRSKPTSLHSTHSVTDYDNGTNRGITKSIIILVLGPSPDSRFNYTL